MRILVAVGSLLVMASSCGDDVCPALPCPVPMAIEVNVTSSGGAQVRTVDGPRGTYQLDIGAPGFQSVHRTPQVTSSGTRGCSTCDIVDTQHLSITLLPTMWQRARRASAPFT